MLSSTMGFLFLPTVCEGPKASLGGLGISGVDSVGHSTHIALVAPIAGLDPSQALLDLLSWLLPPVLALPCVRKRATGQLKWRRMKKVDKM
ncbi:hypothetical protein B296_00004474 [Ensete ventricosum]|uniref:Uncharacterized protein n=1 Tax=Ensete ventricosum TaxID=4639 RepID=A0A427B5X9_ENSVE|nr:hypothetical protein B296_00004474 [Ensete ventricosum]